MISKGNRPNKTQSDWLDLVALSGPIVNGTGRIEIHHVVGFTGKHNKVHIGPWWLLPLPADVHALVGSAEFDLKAFGFVLGGRFDAEKLLFKKLIDRIPTSTNFIGNEVFNAILDYRR